MARHPADPDKRTRPFSFRVSNAALDRAISRAGGRRALAEKLRTAVERWGADTKEDR